MRSLRRTIPGAVVAAVAVLGPSAAAAAQGVPIQTDPPAQGDVSVQADEPPECRGMNVTDSFTNMSVDTDTIATEEECRMALEAAKETIELLGGLFGGGFMPR